MADPAPERATGRRSRSVVDHPPVALGAGRIRAVVEPLVVPLVGLVVIPTVDAVAGRTVGVHAARDVSMERRRIVAPGPGQHVMVEGQVEGARDARESKLALPG